MDRQFNRGWLRWRDRMATARGVDPAQRARHIEILRGLINQRQIMLQGMRHVPLKPLTPEEARAHLNAYPFRNN